MIYSVRSSEIAQRALDEANGVHKTLSYVRASDSSSAQLFEARCAIQRMIALLGLITNDNAGSDRVDEVGL